jgi:hypothetical protein
VVPTGINAEDVEEPDQTKPEVVEESAIRKPVLAPTLRIV